jgi:WD40 repeat protein/tRNA A-37 threonylcarbamoyl transferase component Bud32
MAVPLPESEPPVRPPVAPLPCDDRTLTIRAPAGADPTALPATPRLYPPTTPGPPRPDPGFPRVRGYDILAVVGSGGMGIVYGARHRQLNRRVAIKTLRGEGLADSAFRDRFRAEAEAIARLQHPNIIQVFEVGTVEPLPGETHPSPFIALEYVDGGSLADRARSPQPPREAARMVETVARAAHAAHLVGVIHRDLKPANVLLTRDGEPKVVDFGVAKQLGGASSNAALTRAGYIVGTPEYLAPEQFAGSEATPAVDTYSLGVILYELLTARVPIQGATAADTLRLALYQDPVPPRRLQPGVPRDLETICLKCLEKTPSRRYESAEALADDLARWAGGRPILARALGPTGRAARWAGRNPAVAGLSVAVGLVAVAGLIGILWGWTAARRHAADAEASATAASFAEGDARDAEAKERWERYRVSVMAASAALRLFDTNAARAELEAAPEAYRDWVWRLLRAQLDRSRAVLRGSETPLRHARFTRDGGWAVLQGYDGSFRLWNVADRREYGPLDLGRERREPILSPDGKVLACVTDERTVRLVEPTTGHTRTVLTGHTGPVYDVTFLPGGSRVSTVSDDGTLRIWDVADGRLLRLFRAPPDAGSPLVVSPDGRSVAARGADASPGPRVWDLATGKLQFTLNAHHGNAHAVAFSPAGDRIVTVSRFPQTELFLWDAATGKRLAVLRGHQNQVNHFAFSPDGTRLVSASVDRTARVWDISPTPAGRETEALVVLRGHAGWVRHAVFSPDGSRMATSSQDRTVRYWDARTGELLAVLCGHADQVAAAAFRAGGKELVSASADGTLRLWDLVAAESGYAVRMHENFVYHVAYFPDGKRVASAAWDGTARVWDPSTGRELLRLDHGTDQYVVAVAVHAQGRYLATLARHEGASQMTIRLWDMESGGVPAFWHMPTAWQDGRIAFAPHGDLFAAAGWDGRVRLYDASTRVEVAVLECGKAPVKDVAFSPDGTLLATGSDNGDCVVRLWDVATRTCVRDLRGHTLAAYALAWNRAGTVLASGSLDGTVRLWNPATGECIGIMQPGTEVHGVAFTADGKLLAGACADNLVRVWDVSTRRELAELSGHTSYVHHLAFSPDGTQMVTASGDRTLRVWDTLPRAEREGR